MVFIVLDLNINKNIFWTDAFEVMRVTYSVSEWALADLTDMTLVSEDTFFFFWGYLKDTWLMSDEDDGLWSFAFGDVFHRVALTSI